MKNSNEAGGMVSMHLTLGKMMFKVNHSSQSSVAEVSLIAQVLLTVTPAMKNNRSRKQRFLAAFCTIVYCLRLKVLCVCVCEREGAWKTEADKFRVDVDYCQQVQIEDCFCIVPSEWLPSVRGISYADCGAINNILLWCGRVCLLAWHLGFNSRG